MHLSSSCEGRKRSHFFSSFFFDKFSDGRRDMRRWAKKAPGRDIFKLDKLFLICNITRSHWTCVVTKMQDRRIEYYDSMSGDDGSRFTSIIRKYIHDEWTYNKGGGQQLPQSGADSWQIENMSDGVPQQLNGYDCGVFTIMFANYISINKKMEFNQSDIDTLQPILALAIKKKWRINNEGEFECT